MEATGTFHLSRPRLYGPAERTLIQPWITELTHQTLNAYAEVEVAEVQAAEVAAKLAVIEVLPVQAPIRRIAGRRVVAAAA